MLSTLVAVLVASTSAGIGGPLRGILLAGPFPGNGAPTSASALRATASAMPTSGVPPLPVQFHASVTGGAAPFQYSWSFGGSATSSAKSPAHTFPYTGNYLATVTVTDAAQRSSRSSVSITVGPAVFRAAISASPSSGTAPLATGFTATVKGGVGPYTYAWSFGDGGSSAKASPSHTYQTAAAYTAGLTATDAQGATTQATMTVAAASKLSGIPASLIAGSQVAVTSPRFWSLDVQTACATCLSTNASVTRFLSHTPFAWVRYGQSEDECNISADRLYSPDGVASVGCGFSLASLKAWCGSTAPHCHTILGLPGENNRSAEDAAIASWIVHTVGFQPDFWAIGNEPTGWTHYGIPWTSWKSTDHSTPTPLAYAFDVKAAIRAVSAVDPAAKFVGIESACSCNTVWFQDSARIDGSAISAMAFHNYPSSGRTTETLSEFYAPLGGPSNVTSSLAAVRSAIRGSCPGCGSLPLFVNEYNAGPGWAPSNYAGTYANAVFLAASVAQALRANVTQLTVFNLESESPTGFGYALLNSHGAVGPTGTLYSEVLSHLAMGDVFAGGVSTSLAGVWSVLTTNDTARSLLVVNTNTTQAVGLSLPGTLLSGRIGSVYDWSPGSGGPTAVRGAVLAGYTVPAQGILLIDVPILDLLAPVGPPTISLAPLGEIAVDPAGAATAVGSLVGLALLVATPPMLAPRPSSLRG